MISLIRAAWFPLQSEFRAFGPSERALPTGMPDASRAWSPKTCGILLSTTCRSGSFPDPLRNAYERVALGPLFLVVGLFLFHAGHLLRETGGVFLILRAVDRELAQHVV